MHAALRPPVRSGALRVFLVEDSPAILQRLEALLATVEGARSLFDKTTEFDRVREAILDRARDRH